MSTLGESKQLTGIYDCIGQTEPTPDIHMYIGNIRELENLHIKYTTHYLRDQNQPFFGAVAYHPDIYEYMCQILLFAQKSWHMSTVFWKLYLTFDIHEDHIFLLNSPCSNCASFLLMAFDLNFWYVPQPWFVNISWETTPSKQSNQKKRLGHGNDKDRRTDVQQPLETMRIMWNGIYAFDQLLKSQCF